MLTAFRAFAKSWVAALLIGLLIISFAVFGMSDVLQGQFSNDVIKAGDRTLSDTGFRRKYDQWRQQTEQQVGQPITPQMADENGIIPRLLEQIATSEALMAMLHKVGIRPGDSLVADQLRQIPAFFDPITGRFDSNLMAQRLSQADLTPDDFLVELKDEIAQQHFAAGLVSGLRAPRAYGALAAMIDREQRDLGYFQVDVNNVEEPALPTDAQLQAFMQENAAQLTQPEYRVLSLVRFAPRPQDFEVEVTQAQLQERFEFRRDTLSQPETRTLVQIPAKDQAAAARIAQRLREGEDPGAVARDLGVDPIRYDGRPRTAIADRKVAEAAFALAAGEVSTPIEGDLGFAVVKVTAVTPGRQPTLEDVRPMLEAEIREDAAAEKVYERTQAYEEAHIGGASLAEAAQAAEATVITLPAISEQGRTPEGQPVDGITPKVLETAFGLSEGGESDLTELAEGQYFAVKVERVIPAALPPLDEVRPLLARAWMQREMVRRLEAKAAELAELVRGGQTLEAAAGTIGARVTRATSLSRATAQQTEQLSEDMLVKAFSAEPDEVFTARAVDFAVVVAKLEAIRPGATAEIAAAVENGRGQASMALFRDIAEAASLSAREKVRVRIDENRARAVLGLQPRAETDTPAAKAPTKAPEPKA
ncbi:peptidylprolyl isomerase [Phenylobacterium sp.]|uniref:peptidylprolyl isomerase n=1 Tax=Phenylobacterium sp. TaxID=1871053 RepID=UPI0027304B35|nr:peptidylprolyl isomerase [Phenylobacterium sp.]MDP1618509.1 peptidyl-prolyl cis-trans isomerase [Phenylobacterium sp.]MDP1987191.1 peptidyl-prolyl cis-trans isomerase [Phenylobacterium sp.]